MYDERSDIGNYSLRHTRNNVVNFLCDRAVSDPDHPLLRWQEAESVDPQTLVASAFSDRVLRLARGMHLAGLRSQDTALVFLPMSVPMYACMFALQAIGAIPVFLDSWARRDDVGPALEIANCKAVISGQRGLDWISGLPESHRIERHFCWGSYSAAPANGAATDPIFLQQMLSESPLEALEAVDREHTALVTFTTGSTGRPKGADRSHRFLADQHAALLRHLPYERGDIDLPLFPVFSLNSLAAGVTTILPFLDLAQPGPNDAVRIALQIDVCGATCATLSPVLFRSLPKLAAGGDAPHFRSLRRVVTGGAPISRQEIAEWKKFFPHVNVEVLYGSTEVEPMAHLSGSALLARPSRSDTDPLWVDDGVWLGQIDDALEWALVPHGMAIEDARRALEIDPKALHVGMGELWVRGSHVCPRYYNDPEATQRAKVATVDGLWHRTGDVVRRADDDTLWMVGRVPQRVCSSHGELYPVRSEMIARKVRGVAHAALLEMPGPQAWLVIEANIHEPPIEAVGAALAHNGITVDRIMVTKSIPLDARHHSKVNYGVLRRELLQSASQIS